jgi:hypothetical protein
MGIILFANINNLYIKTPRLMRPFSEFPSMVAIERFDYMLNQNRVDLYDHEILTHSIKFQYMYM